MKTADAYYYCAAAVTQLEALLCLALFDKPTRLRNCVYPLIPVIQSVTALFRISKKASCKLSQDAVQTIRWRSVCGNQKQQFSWLLLMHETLVSAGLPELAWNELLGLFHIMAAILAD